MAHASCVWCVKLHELNIYIYIQNQPYTLKSRKEEKSSISVVDRHTHGSRCTQRIKESRGFDEHGNSPFQA
jgi:hypothetical protein